MAVKEIPVPTGEEAEGLPEEQVEQEVEQVKDEALPEIIPETKPVKKEESWTKVTPKRKAKAKKEEEKIDLKQRMPCPICKKLYTLHSLLYTHQCTKDARAAKQKKSTIIEKPTPLPEPEPVIAPRDPPPLVRQPVQMSYREALLERRFAIEARQRELHTTPIRNYFGRS